MTDRDPRIDPKIGDIVRAPKKDIVREVTKVDIGFTQPIIHYNGNSCRNTVAKRETYLSDWQRWCRTHKVEVVRPVRII